MWIINCILLIIGTIAGVTGFSFYVRNRENDSNIRFYIFSYGLSSALWCISYGTIGTMKDLSMCGMVRRAGVFAIDAFLLTEVFLISEISGVGKRTVRIAKIAAVILSVFDFLFYSQEKVDLFVRRNGLTTWMANPEYRGSRIFHTVYIILIFLTLFLLGIAWIRTNKLKRLIRFLFMAFISNFLLLFFCLPDTFLPAMGKTAVSTSGIGAALCAIVMWYGAIRLNSFDIRMGNIKEKVFEFLDAGVIVFDVNYEIAIVNRYAGEMAGSGEIQRKGLSDYFDIEENAVKELFASARDAIYSVRLWDKAGKKAYSLRINGVKDDYGDLFCYMCVFVDVTQEVEAVSKFEIASTAKSRFLAQMSHEIRTPINAVLGMNEMILRESEDAEILEYAENISSAGNTLLSLINSILDFSKIEDGKMDIIPVTYDTSSFMNDIVNSIIQRADAKGLKLQLDVDETLPCMLLGDDVRFSQVIMNLLTNAVKYTEKGTVTLSVKNAGRDREKIKIHVAVRDTGIGIKNEDLGRLFESFERLDEIRNRNIEGTGLGISIVTSLLKMMGSKLSVESTYGEGSVFSFTIEQQIVDETPIGDYEKRVKESSKTKIKDKLIQAPAARVLLVDDNVMNLKVAKNLLKLCGIKPDMVSSGEDAVESMREHVYDIVFLDHMMPVMDGIETLHRLQEEKLIPDKTVMVALTANAVVGARETYLSEGFADYLSKPMEVKELVGKLKKYLPEEAYEQADSQENAAQDSKNENRKEEVITEDISADNTEVLEFTPEEEIIEFTQGEEVLEFVPDEEIIEFSPGEETMEVTPEETEKAAKEHSPAYDVEKLKAAGIRTETGLKYCGGEEELYYEMLREFSASGEEKTAAMEELFRKRNWKDYKVFVHAAKSNTKMIGAVQVSEQAKALEDAARAEDRTFIEEHHEEFVRAYREVVKEITDKNVKKMTDARR